MRVAEKPWYRSKTIWTNFLTGIATLLAVGAEVMPANAAPYVAAALAMVNIILRAVTIQPLR